MYIQIKRNDFGYKKTSQFINGHQSFDATQSGIIFTNIK